MANSLSALYMYESKRRAVGINNKLYLLNQYFQWTVWLVGLL